MDIQKYYTSPDFLWDKALKEWDSRGKELAVELLRGDALIPAAARLFLADFLDGKLKTPRGRPKKQAEASETMKAASIRTLIKDDFETELNNQQKNSKVGDFPKDIALDEVATLWNMTPDQVSHIVYPRKGKKIK